MEGKKACFHFGLSEKEGGCFHQEPKKRDEAARDGSQRVRGRWKIEKTASFCRECSSGGASNQEAFQGGRILEGGGEGATTGWRRGGSDREGRTSNFQMMCVGFFGN